MSKNFKRHGFEFQLAQPQHDQAIADLLNTNAIPGWIKLSYKTSTGFHRPLNKNITSASVIGVHETSHEIGGIATRSVHPGFVDGEEAEIGWLGQLRIAPQFQKRAHLLRSGFEAVHRFLHDSQQTPTYLASIIADNTNARKILEAGLEGFPVFEPLMNYRVMAFSTGQAKSKISKHVRPAEQHEMPKIIDFINAENRGYDYSPRFLRRNEPDEISAGDWLGLSPQDFLIHEEGGKISGVIALWDQQKYRQMQVQGYQYLSPLVRKLMNTMAPVTGLPELPNPGKNLHQVYLSLPTIVDDNHDVALELYSAALTVSKQRGAALCLAGFTEYGLRQFRSLGIRHFNYDSIIYRVYWPNEVNLVHNSPPARTKIEVGLL